MTAENFCYWLQGYFEILTAADGPRSFPQHALAPAQVDEIRKHLSLVMTRVTPKIDPTKTYPIEEPRQGNLTRPPNWRDQLIPTPKEFPRGPEIYCATGPSPQVECSLDAQKNCGAT